MKFSFGSFVFGFIFCITAIIFSFFALSDVLNLPKFSISIGGVKIGNAKQSESGSTKKNLLIQYPTKSEPFEEFGFFDENSKKLHLKDFSGKKLIVHGWATTCVPCMVELPDFVNFAESFSKPDYEIIVLNYDLEKDIEKAKSVLANESGGKVKFYHAENPSDTKQLRATGIPFTIFIDKNGLEIGRVFSNQDWKSFGLMME